MVGVLHVTFLASLRTAGRDIGVEVTAVKGGTLHRSFKLQVGSQTMTLTAHQRVFQQGALLDGMPLMLGYVLIAIHDPFLRTTVNHCLLVMAHQTTYIQLAYCGLVIFRDSLGNLRGNVVRPALDLRKVALEARKVGLGRFSPRFNGQRTYLEVRSHKYPVVQTHQRSRMMRPFPLLVDFLMTFPATGGVEQSYQFIQRRDLLGGVTAYDGTVEKHVSNY